MVSSLGAVISLNDLLPESIVLDLNLVGVDRLQALVQHLKHEHQLSANLLEDKISLPFKQNGCSFGVKSLVVNIDVTNTLNKGKPLTCKCKYFRH